MDRSKAGTVLTSFYSRGGELLAIPESFVSGVKAAVQGAACVGCSHSHFLVPRQGDEQCRSRFQAALLTL
jgi:hypothetical protein